MRPSRTERAARAAAPALILAVACAAPLRGQAVGQGFEYERLGQLPRAAEVYLAGVRANPTYLPALLGLERVLPQLGRLPELLPLVRQAVAQDAGNPALRGLELRVLAGLGAYDSLAAAARAWAALAPADETPYREWAHALEAQRLPAEARRVLLAGRQRLGRPEALAADLAALGARSGDWETAAAEWAAVVVARSSQASLAGASLSAAPPAARERVISALTAPPARADAGVEARRLAAELLVVWGQPLRAWEVFAATLGANVGETAGALRRFADRAVSLPGGEGRRVRGLALERLASLIVPAQRAQVLLEAARAYVAGGDHVAARRVLDLVSQSGAIDPQLAALAEATLISVMIEEGARTEAAARLLARGDQLLAEDAQALSERLAWAEIRHGELDRAAELFAQDSSVQGSALRGWIALFRGDLAGAIALFRQAGPYTGDRAGVTARTQILALLAAIDAASLPALGQALLVLEQGDTVRAIEQLRGAAARLPADRGRGDVLLLAGRLARTRGDHRGAEELFGSVLRETGDGKREAAAPPAAELELARLLLERGAREQGIARLEHLIITYPTSAVVPQARRELEQARGAIPRS